MSRFFRLDPTKQQIIFCTLYPRVHHSVTWILLCSIYLWARARKVHKDQRKESILLIGIEGSVITKKKCPKFNDKTARVDKSNPIPWTVSYVIIRDTLEVKCKLRIQNKMFHSQLVWIFITFVILHDYLMEKKYFKFI